MAYLHLAEDSLGQFGCGPRCSCGPCRNEYAGLAETYEPAPADESATSGYGRFQPRSPISAYGGFSRYGQTTCPAPARTATDRCRIPQPCAAIPNLICTSTISGKPVEYIDKVRVDPATHLKIPAIQLPRRAHQVRMLPQVGRALERFVGNMARFAMPVEALLTAGSLYCRCVRGTNSLSNHSFGDAFDLVGVRWPLGSRLSPLRETIVHNWADLSGERIVLRRINACLRLSFRTVIDYHRSDHRDHFHCDMNRGRPRQNGGPSNMTFVQEALAVMLARPFEITGRLDAASQQGLREFARLPASTSILGNREVLDKILKDLFTAVAAGLPGR
jgi:Extensin-like protein C-terminus